MNSQGEKNERALRLADEWAFSMLDCMLEKVREDEAGDPEDFDSWWLDEESEEDMHAREFIDYFDLRKDDPGRVFDLVRHPSRETWLKLIRR